jgi:hypothetical protein
MGGVVSQSIHRGHKFLGRQSHLHDEITSKSEPSASTIKRSGEVLKFSVIILKSEIPGT